MEAAALTAAERTGVCAALDVICFSHLTWDWVWQRPQQILTRLGPSDRILFVEEPRLRAGSPPVDLSLEQVAPRVTAARFAVGCSSSAFRHRIEEAWSVLESRVDDDVARRGEAMLPFDGAWLPAFSQMLASAVGGWRSGAPLVAYVYTPLAAPLLDALAPDLIVYDAMDDLATFAFAHPAMQTREHELLGRAAVVLAGSASLFRKKRFLHPDVRLVASGVHVADFRVDGGSAGERPAALRDVAGPVIGYCGVVDERTDFDLVAAVCAERPEWTWVMVGPLAKLSADALPRPANLRYVGLTPYAELKYWLAHTNVATIPFRQSETTRNLRPTKLLEYFAAGRPVVSTPLHDVAVEFSDCVRFARTPREFAGELAAALAETPAARALRIEKAAAHLERYSWDAIAAAIRAALVEKLGSARA